MRMFFRNIRRGVSNERETECFIRIFDKNIRITDLEMRI